MEFNYTKKPSITVLRAAIKQAAKLGETQITLVWGENVIDIEYHANRDKWSGNGWIGRNGGFDLANELNIRASFDRQMDNPIQFLRDHVQFIHIK
jgi:hypothetical protein